MSKLTHRLCAAYPEGERAEMLPTTKACVLAYLDELKEVVRELEEFSSFPEGAQGVALYVLLCNDAQYCPDAGDFGPVLHNAKLALHVCGEVVLADVIASMQHPSRSER